MKPALKDLGGDKGEGKEFAITETTYTEMLLGMTYLVQSGES